ncbi:oxidoreductase [Rufibacter immobilis]|uniref:Oxidoreductase n=1 Tax=Rufibacter immobilis TaxID=1348778 RepID=A0A3M9MXG8_9BACT|nr:FAD/NAD(P)-binding protein [Rufibacter immobilis]RNI29458.1 oxidoreductase [Rufibacter immobilis]
MKEHMEPVRIAIVGGGLSGTLTAINLLLAAREATVIYLLEKEAQKMSRGVAYSSSLPFQPLNVPAYRMSLFLDVPHDFVEWLQENQHRYPEQLPTAVTPHDFIPRNIFGDYVEHSLLAAEQHAQPGVQLVRVRDEAVALVPAGETGAFTVHLKNHAPLQAQKAVLAFGNLAPANLPIPTTSFYDSPFYKPSPWSAEVVNALPQDASLLLIGSSLTMVDLVGSLMARGHQGKIYVVSRHGMVPKAYLVGTKPYTLSHLPLNQHLSPLEALRYVRQEIQQAQLAGITWHSVLDVLRDHLPAVWQNFTLWEKKQFLRHVKPQWEVHRHRMPQTSHALLAQLQRQGQLEIIPADVLDMQTQGSKALVNIRKRKKGEKTTLEVDQVVNCTGPLCNYAKAKEPLIQQLLREGLIAPDPLRLGLSATPDGVLLNAQGEQTENLFTLGPPLKGILYETTALREIRQQAAALAGLLLFGETMLATV